MANDDKANAEPSAADHPQLVLVFRANSGDRSSLKGKEADEQRSKIAVEYDSLLNRLQSVGLQVSTRPGGNHQILVFVRASVAALSHAATLERANDYLHGVRSSSEAPVSRSRTSSLPGKPLASVPKISPADALRFAHSLVTNPKCEDSSAAWHTISGAGVVVGSEPFPHVVDLLALHDDAFNKDWIRHWTSPSSAFRIGPSDLDRVRDHFGEQIAFYFGFLTFYFNALLPVALWGLTFWVAGRPYDVAYSAVLVAWACVFIEAWRMRERKLAVRWSCAGVTAAEGRRKDFAPRIIRSDPISGEKEEVFEWWRVELRIALAVPVLLFFAGILAAVMTLIFVLEAFVAKVYSGPGKAIVPLIPTGLFATAIPQIMAAWQATANRLTRFENHRTEGAHQSSLTLKMFALQALVAYGALTLSAFVYIPFGQQIMDAIVNNGLFARSISEGVQSGALHYDHTGKILFDVNPNRMQTQLFAVSVTSQAINAFTELALPMILRGLKNRKGEPSRKDHTGVSVVVKRALEQIALPPYEIFTDYAEMATQFGFIALWSTIWPLSPVMGFVNNFFEIRSDAAKICLNARRPVPARVESIGPWLEVLGFIAWLSALSNAALLYLFDRGSPDNAVGLSPYSTVLRQHGGFAQDTNHSVSVTDSLSRLLPIDSQSSPRASTLLVAFLLALASEHGYALFRAAVRHVLERFSWRGSAEAEALMRREWQSRRNLLHMFERRPSQPTELSPIKTESAFWTQSDQCRELIVNPGKTE